MTDKERRDEREAAFVRSLPDDRPFYVEGFPPIYPDSPHDADHVDIEGLEGDGVDGLLHCQILLV